MPKKLTVTEINDQMGGLVKDMRGLLDAAEAENRELTTDESTQYDRMEKDLDALEEGKAVVVEAKKRADRLARLEGELEPPPRKRVQPGTSAESEPEEAGRTLYELYQAEMELGANHREAFRVAAKSFQSPLDAPARQAFSDYLREGQSFLPKLREHAALQMDSVGGGGSLVLPEDFVARVIIGLDEALPIRGLITMLPMTSAVTVGIPALGADPADSTWGTELSTGTLDSTMTTSKRNLSTNPLTSRILVSKTLLRRSAVPADAFVRSRLTFKHGVTMEKGLLTGSGSGQPLGMFTASAQGINTDRDYSTDNTTTAMTADGLIGAFYNNPSQYHPVSSWIFHRDGVAQIRKLKTGDGQYIWQPGLAGDRPGTILDRPYVVSEQAPNTFTTGLYTGIVGNLGDIWGVESLAMTIEVLNELHAATNQAGYYLRSEFDAMPVLSEGLTRVTLA